MNNQNKPPPPVLPPSFKVSDTFCLLHKGNLDGEIYVCPSCKTKYCMNCAQKAKEEAKLCITCKNLFYF
jgi:hypothetical protein